ncbi:MAG: N-acetylmuramoyl-L-alanine amidase [Lachnospiraceae bacterium]|nr:N-acetylmuramoyl-L-alanine amidase [Lachnospiraceae bacterium]
MIHTGEAILYRAKKNRNNIVVGVNAGHGTQGGSSVFTMCHPDGTPKLTGGSTAAGSLQATAVSVGMTFFDGTPERDVNLKEARIFRDLLLDAGYDVLMIRDGDDVQLDNIARTVICNNNAACHIAIHWDGDGLDYDKGCFVMTVPDGLKTMYPVSEIWQEDDRLGESLIQGLQSVGAPIHGNGLRQLDLTQTSYSKIPSIDIELGNAASDHSDDALWLRARGLLAGVNIFFGR